jgi:glycosyltransferase involved in cell wall biosynthesis
MSVLKHIQHGTFRNAGQREKAVHTHFLDSNSQLKVSCLCPSYNRAPHSLSLVEEAIESFLRQDYPCKELVVLNDTPGQRLRCDHPEVRIVNTDFRCASLGEKRNLMAGLATGELLCVWDDDDISLPWRLSTAVRLLGDAEYYNAGAYWFLDGADLHHDHRMGVSYFTSVYRKSAYLELGGTPDISMGEDAAMDQKLREACRVAAASPLPLDQWYYLYRWGPSPCHLSSVPGDTYYAALGTVPIVRGEFRLQPRWQRDYVALTQNYIVALEPPLISASRSGKE